MTDTAAPDPRPLLPRRRFVQLAVGGLGAAVAGFALYRFLNDDDPTAAVDGLTTDPARGGYGPLTDAGPLLALPVGFAYAELTYDGRTMSDGRPTPGAPDGMAAFAAADGAIRLVRNHELGGGATTVTPAYDPAAAGGTTTLVIDPDSRELVADWTSLAGTSRNCAGGPTPWGSWITCEETVDGPDQGFAAPHGYAFDVAADAEAPVEPIALTGMGRFRREAVAVDAEQGVVYQTEDAEPDAGLYRYVVDAGPAAPGRPLDLVGGGRLQALAVVDRPGLDLRSVAEEGATFPVGWVDIDEPDADVEGGISVVGQAVAAGAARFRRLEGCDIDDGSVWFTSTDGGHGNGQIWRLDPARPGADDDAVSGPAEGGTLTMAFAAVDGEVLQGPDNLVLSPQGSLVICEDNGRGFNRLVALSPDGALIPLVANIANDKEFAGATFSPDGRTLFVNTQGSDLRGIRGRTFAIWGPWGDGAV
ncbi:MAG: alkaline phosphatase PhoX [Actinomycetota bacterium]